MPLLSSQATAAGAGTDPQRPRFEVADVVREYGRRSAPPITSPMSKSGCCGRSSSVGPRLSGAMSKPARRAGPSRSATTPVAIATCPKCQGSARAQWLAAEQALLLPVPYFHVVFTLPHQLNPLLRVNPRGLYNLLFQAAAQTLQEFARDPKHLGAEIGITAVLHTWGQTLTEHIHVHCVVTGGGLIADGTQWRANLSAEH